MIKMTRILAWIITAITAAVLVTLSAQRNARSEAMMLGGLLLFVTLRAVAALGRKKS